MAQLAAADGLMIWNDPRILSAGRVPGRALPTVIAREVPRMSPTIRRLAPYAAAAATAAALALPASSGAATTCKLSLTTARHMGPTYVTSVKVSGTSCDNGVKVTKAFQSCRLKHGKKGRCTTKVLGYACTEKRPADLTIPTEFTGQVTCKRGGARVTHEYQQNT
jgi:hypothetical protein